MAIRGLKTLIFSDGDSVNVICKCTLQNYSDMEENFIITDIRGINGHPDIKLFYWLLKGLPYTLTELEFFAINNNLCIFILDPVGGFLTSYGVCGVDHGRSPFEYIVTGSGDTFSFSDPRLIGQVVGVAIDGFVQCSLTDYSFDSAGGEIDFNNELEVGQRVVIFIVDDVAEKVIGVGDSRTSYSSINLIGKQIGYTLDGLVQNASQFSFNSATGTIVPIVPFEVEQRIVVFVLRGITGNPLEHKLVSGDSLTVYSNTILIDKVIIFIRDGFVQSRANDSPELQQFTFDNTTGQIIPYDNSGVNTFTMGQALAAFFL